MSDLEVAVAAPDGYTTTDAREALSALTEDEVSSSSPITPGCPEAGTATRDAGDSGGVRVVVTVSGHNGSFTKKSTQAVTTALEQSAEGAEVVSVDGGYSPD